ncbi:hypothetical protein EVA_13595 [gut metagenome]|uniref:Uncharacterized protein n=1 Tax=gut metagenome TaxID=749906 RepID=J9GG31_9ZZZZ
MNLSSYTTFSCNHWKCLGYSQGFHNSLSAYNRPVFDLRIFYISISPDLTVIHCFCFSRNKRFSTCPCVMS